MKIYLSRAADKFLSTHPKVLEDLTLFQILSEAYRKVAHIENNNSNVKELKGEWKGNYRVRFGKLRIIFTIEAEDKIQLLFVKKIGFRKDVYE